MNYKNFLFSLWHTSKQLPWLIAEHFFLFFLLLTGVSLVITGSIFLRYREAPIGEYQTQGIQFQIGSFRELLEIQENRRKMFDQAGSYETKNIFFPFPQVETTIEEAPQTELQTEFGDIINQEVNSN